MILTGALSRLQGKVEMRYLLWIGLAAVLAVVVGDFADRVGGLAFKDLEGILGFSFAFIVALAVGMAALRKSRRAQ